MRGGIAAAIALALSAGVATAQEDPDADLQDLSLEQLMAVPVTTASNVDEKLADAPAAMIVITRDEMEARGYTQLGDLFDDLPGMDVVRPYGDNWVLAYWRGFRADVSAPFLLMVDGLPVNSLHYLDVDVPLTSLPLSEIDRVEIVSGPASSVYGPNAFMGVINVITVSDAADDGLTEHARIGLGGGGERVADAMAFYKRGPLRFRLAARFDTGLLDDSHRDLYEYAKASYQENRNLWGGFVDNPNLGGADSRHIARAVDAHLYYEDTELAASWMAFTSGYGMEYAGDRALANAAWTRYELDAYLRHAIELTDHLESRTVLRYREGGIDNESFFVDGYSDDTRGRVAAFSYWQYLNFGWSAYQDVALSTWHGVAAVAGLKLEQKDLQKAYDIAGEGAPGTPGGYERVADLTASDYLYPTPPAPVREPWNRTRTEDIGAYVQVRDDLTARHHLHLGARIDRNSGYDWAPTVRAGYVGELGGGLRVKALYGQAFQEPPPRVLYGGWTGSGSDPDLKPQRSQTAEIDTTLTLKNLWQGLDVYYVHSTDTIAVGAMPRNVGKQTVIGLDWTFRALVPTRRLERLELWGSYTRLFAADQEIDDAGVRTDEPIGDLSRDKVHLGASALYDKHLSGTLRGRWFGRRETTPTNPVRSVPGFATVDATLQYRHIHGTGLGLSASVYNLTDAAYVHPGINDASAGDIPGAFDQNGKYQGSQGFFASELPQPGRTFLVSLWIEP